MKKNIIFLLFFLFPLSLLAQVDVLHFDDEVYDFGTIEEDGGRVSCIFKITNKGKLPIIIHSVNAPCGCTMPEWTKNPILSEKEGRIKITYDPSNRPGIFSKKITVKTSSGIKQLLVKGMVTLGKESLTSSYPRKMGQLRLVTSYALFDAIGNKQQRTIAVVNDSEESISISFAEVPSYITVDIDKKKLAPKEEGVITIVYDADKADSFGFNKNIVPVLINGTRKVANSLLITATVIDDFSNMNEEALQNAPVLEVDKFESQFAKVVRGDKVKTQFKIKNIGKTPLILRKIDTSSEALDVKIHTKVIMPGTQAFLEVTFDTTAKSGYQNQTITLITNVPDSPIVNFRLIGVVE